MITNLIFDLSGYGGSANFTATTTTDLINELNTLTGVTWYWDPADCKPKSNFYPGVPPVITTAYKVSFVDIDGDSTGFCNAGSLDFTKFNEMDLSAYGGSATTTVTNNTDIVNAFAALSLTVNVLGCDLIIDNWDHVSIPSNVEVNNTASCVITTTEVPGFNYSSSTTYETGAPINGLDVEYLKWGNGIGTGPVTVNWGDGNILTYPDPGFNGLYTFAGPGNYSIVATYNDNYGNPVQISNFMTIDAAGDYKNMQNNTTPSPRAFRVNDIQTTFTFDTSDCNNVKWSAMLPSGWSVMDVGTTYEVEVILGGTTTAVSGTPSSGTLFSVFTNISMNYTGPGTYPITVNYKCDGVITGILTTNLYIS